MAESESPIWNVQPGDQLTIRSPDVGPVTVLLPKPKKHTKLKDGTDHVVFVRPNGRMIGMNTDVSVNENQCILVEDEDGFQHALVGYTDEPVVMTRRQPGEPSDWEQRDGFEIELTEYN